MDLALPFEVERWLTFSYIYISALSQQRDEFIDVARAWLSKYPYERSHLGEAWLRTHTLEPDMNVILRHEIGRHIRFVVNDKIDWSGPERIRLLEEFMGPLLDDSVANPYSREVLHANLCYLDWLEAVEAIGAQTRVDELRNDEEAFNKYVRDELPVFRLDVARKRQSACESLVPVVGELSDNPTAFKGIFLGSVEEISRVHKKVMSARSRANRRLTNLQAENTEFDSQALEGNE